MEELANVAVEKTDYVKIVKEASVRGLVTALVGVAVTEGVHFVVNKTKSKLHDRAAEA